MAIRLKTPAEDAAYAEGVRIRNIMASPEYLDPIRRDPRVVAEVEAAFRRAYGTAPVTAPIGPGEEPGGFGEAHPRR